MFPNRDFVSTRVNILYEKIKKHDASMNDTYCFLVRVLIEVYVHLFA